MNVGSQNGLVLFTGNNEEQVLFTITCQNPQVIFALFDSPQRQIFKVSYYLKPFRGTSPTTKKNTQTNNLVYQCDLCFLVSVQ